LEEQVKISARNQLKGTVKSVNHGAVNSEVVIEVAPGVEVTSIITKTSAESLGLAPGSTAYAVIKASNVMIAAE
jgi:molybdopterin-binding protein